ncbi:MAG: hypothetical protein MJ082_00720 [Clostridia bacterium]|nr:hypothetical protein [Clostridia bacterium]
MHNYAGETRVSAKNTLSALLRSYADLLPASVATGFLDRIPSLSARLEEVFYAEGIAEADYLSFFDGIEERKTVYSKLLYDALNGGIPSEEADTLRDFMRLLFSHFGTTTLEGLLRGMIDCKFDYTIGYNLSLAEKYPSVGYRYKNKAEDARRRKTIFDGIDNRAFAAVSRGMLLSSGAFLASLDNASFPEEFTDAEIASVIRSLDTDITLSTDEWMVLFEEFGAIGSVKAFYEATVDAGDEARAAAFFNDLFALLDSAKREISVQTVSDLKTAENGEALGTIYHGLSEQTKAQFARLCEVRFTAAGYRTAIESSADLKEFFAVPTAKAADLDAAESKGFPTLLRGIIRGIFYD